MKTKLQLSKNATMNKPDEKRQGMKVRTVVTGHNAKGRAVFVRDEKVDGTPIPGLGELAFLWNADEPATYPNAGNNPAAPGIFPPLGGIRSEEHTSELQSLTNLVCRLLLEKK